MKTSIQPRNPKILLYDIESSPSKGYFWGGLYEQSIIKVIEHKQMICVAWKWLGEKKVYCSSMRMFPGYRRNLKDNSKLVKKFYSVIGQADITIAHNGISFDEKMVNGEFLKKAITPPPPHFQIDTLREARKHFKFVSNRLDDLGQLLGIGKKVKHPGFSMWEGCMEGDNKSWAQMERYNKGDVFPLLEKVYLKLRPWMRYHPDLTKWTGEGKCSVCSSDKLIPNGEQYNKVTYRIRLLCKDCGKWNTGKLMKKRS